METIRYLLGIITRLVLALLLIALVLQLLSFLYPQFKISNLLSGDFFKRDLLPAPKNYASSLTPKQGGMYGRVYEPAPAFDGYRNNNATYRGQPGIEYVMYTESGTKIIKPDGSIQNEQAKTTTNITTYPNKSVYVRNLSVFDGGGLTYGQTITGEARDTMFKSGTFIVFVADANGRVVASFPAVSTGAWAIPGWSRFQMTVSSRLPANTYCTLFFRSANQPLQVSMPVRCN